MPDSPLWGLAAVLAIIAYYLGAKIDTLIKQVAASNALLREVGEKLQSINGELMMQRFDRGDLTD